MKAPIDDINSMALALAAAERAEGLAAGLVKLLSTGASPELALKTADSIWSDLALIRLAITIAQREQGSAAKEVVK